MRKTKMNKCNKYPVKNHIRAEVPISTVKLMQRNMQLTITANPERCKGKRIQIQVNMFRILCKNSVGIQILTCIAVSFTTKPPADILLMKSSFSFLFFVNRYAASGFSLDLMMLKLSSTLLTFAGKKNLPSLSHCTIRTKEICTLGRLIFHFFYFD